MAIAAVLVAGFSAAFATGASAASDAPPAPNVAPDAVSVITPHGAGRVIVYTGTDGGVYSKIVGSSLPAITLGGHLISAPSAILVGGQHGVMTPVIFGEGTDHALWRKIGAGDWRSLGGRLTSKPGAAVLSAAELDLRVYVRGADGAVWARSHFGPLVDNPAIGWGPWRPVGGRVLVGTGPSAAVSGGAYHILVAGTNRGLFIARDGGNFVDAGGGVTTSSPALVDAPSSRSLVGFARGPANPGLGWFHRFTGNSGWISMGGRLTSGMGGTATDRNWFAYGLGTDNQVWEHRGTTGATGSWVMRTP